MAKGGRKYVEFDDSVFQRQARKLARKLKVDEFEFVKEQTQLLAREVAKMTPPYAKFPSTWKGLNMGSKADIERGETAIFYDVVRILKPVPEGAAGWAQNAFGGGPIIGKGGEVKGPGVFWNKTDLYAWHKQHEKMNGRTKELLKHERPWVPESLWHEYVTERQKDAGMAKATMAKAAQALGYNKGITPKIKRHIMSAKGKGEMNKEKKGPSGEISGAADGLWHTNRHLPALAKNRLKKAVIHLNKVAKAAAKGSGFKVR